MRLQDVKAGDTVIPRRFESCESDAWFGWEAQFVGVPCVVYFKGEDEVQITLNGVYACWPIEYCDALHTEKVETNTERLAATEAIRYAQQLERSLATAKSEAETKIKDLQSQIVNLEKQVIELRAEVQKVGKQRQSGSRFALLELD
jgi:hypothetical protein